MKTASFLTYSTRVFPFAKVLAEQVFRVRSLDRLHVYWQRYKVKKGGSATLTYEDNLNLRRMMQNLRDDSPFYQLYHAFVHDFIAPAFGGKIGYSLHPKMRVHLAGTTGVSRWHRDADITGRPEQINVWVPFTDTFDTNTLWVETDYGSGDYQPVGVRYGQALIFDGGYLAHGTVPNETGSTRVSLDFRFSIVGDEMPPRARVIFDSRPADLKLERSDLPAPGGYE